MSSALEKRTGSVLSTQTFTSTVGSGMAISGAAAAVALPVWLVASLLPGGMLLWAVLFVVLGLSVNIFSSRP